MLFWNCAVNFINLFLFFLPNRYAFAAFATPEQCKAAHDKCQGASIQGHRLVVLYAKKRSAEQHKKEQKLSQKNKEPASKNLTFVRGAGGAVGFHWHIYAVGLLLLFFFFFGGGVELVVFVLFFAFFWKNRLVIIVKPSFMCYFSKLEYIAHYKAKNQNTVKQSHSSMCADTHIHIHSRIAWWGEISKMVSDGGYQCRLLWCLEHFWGAELLEAEWFILGNGCWWVLNRYGSPVLVLLDCDVKNNKKQCLLLIVLYVIFMVVCMWG